MAGAAVQPIIQKGTQAFETLAPSLFRSGFRELDKVPEGRMFSQLMDKYAQTAAKNTEIHVTSGVPREQASRMGRASSDLANFGPHREILSRLISAARQTQGDHYADFMADQASLRLKESEPKEFLKKGQYPFPTATTWRKEAGAPVKSPYSPPGAAEQTWNKISKYMYLSLIAIPHMSQSLGTYLYTRDMNGFLQGISESVHDYNSAADQMLRSGAFTADLAHALKPGSPTWERFLDKFSMPLFEKTRKIQSVVVAMSGKHTAINAAEDYIRSGGTSRVAEDQLTHLGIDPRRVLSSGGQLTQDDLDMAMYKTVEQVMYMRTGQEVPPAWRMTGWARLTTQYKDFAFNQGRFITDAYRRAKATEGWGGVAKLSAYFATVFPLAGELIWSTENTFRKGDPTERQDRMMEAEKRGIPGGREIDEYLTALGRAGGLGLLNTALRAGNNQLISRYAEPALVSFVNDEYGGLQRGTRPNDPNWDAFFRTNLRKFVPVVGTPLAHHFFPYQFEKPSVSHLKTKQAQKIKRAR